MTEGGVVCAQIVLTIFNVIQFVFGWILIIVGAVIKTKKNELPVENHPEVAIFIIVIGCILVAVSLIGCFGAWTKNFCLLVTYCIFTGIILILVLIGLILAFVGRSKSDEVSEETLKKLIEGNDTHVFDVMQQELKCCGINNSTDWKINPKFKENAPGSCCGKLFNDTCSYQLDPLYPKGCKESLSELLKQPLLILGAVASACAIAMFLAIVAAACMAHAIRGSYQAV